MATNLKGLEPMITEVDIKKKFHENKSWNLLYLLRILVQHKGRSSNFS
jgi:hypothetical protein